MSRTMELLALVAAGALGAGLTVLALGASLAFLVPAIVGVGVISLVTTGRAQTPEPPAGLPVEQGTIEAEA